MGLRLMLRPPTVISSAIIPITATNMMIGSSFINRFPGITRGTSGGDCRLTSPPGMRGGDNRMRRMKPCLVISPPVGRALTV
ncbi:hypothetical protein GCM10009701_14990 [Mycolicibacterium murale]|nr:hypothetical protein MTOK_04390 [Mycolicibacterium tokaiense]